MTVDEYINQFPAKTQYELERFHKLITKHASDLKPKVWEYAGTLIGYGTYHYKTKSGNEGDWFIMGLSARKNYISIYSNATVQNSYLVETFQDELPKSAKTGRSCINITKPDEISDELVKRLIKQTLANMPRHEQ